MLVSGMVSKKFAISVICSLMMNDEMCARTIYCPNIDKKVCYLHSCYH